MRLKVTARIVITFIALGIMIGSPILVLTPFSNNPLNNSNQSSTVETTVEAPYFWDSSLNKTIYSPMDLIFQVSGGTLAVGQGLVLTVGVRILGQLAVRYGFMQVHLDGALFHYNVGLYCPSSLPFCFGGAFTTNEFEQFNASDTNAVNWTIASNKIIYDVSGTFGASISMNPDQYLNLSSLIHFPEFSIGDYQVHVHTLPLFTIASSQEVLFNQTTTVIAFEAFGIGVFQVIPLFEREKEQV